MKKVKRTVLLAAVVAVVVVSAASIIVVFRNYRDAQVYIAQTVRQPRGPWPKESVAEAVIVRLEFGTGRSPSDQDSIAALGNQLARVLANSSVGRYDGVDCLHDRCALFFYGSRAEPLYGLVRNVLRKSPVTKHSSVEFRLASSDPEHSIVAKMGCP